MLNNPLVSIIFPAYNHENFVQDTIKSIIAQTYQNIELLVIDDGSTDSTWKKIQEMKHECDKRFTRVVFMTQKNVGANITINRLRNLSRGEYILSTASDDMLKPQCIEKEVNFLINNPNYVLCVGNNEFLDGNNCVCFWDKNKLSVYDIKDSTYQTFGDYLQKERKDVDFFSGQFGEYRSIYIFNYIPNGSLIRKNIMDKIGENPLEKLIEDWWLMLQISKYGKFKYIDEILYSYRWHETNTIKAGKKLKAIFDITRKQENELLCEININNKFNEYLPIVKDVFENGAETLSRNYFNIVKVKTKYIPSKNNKKIQIEFLGIKIYSYRKAI